MIRTDGYALRCCDVSCRGPSVPGAWDGGWRALVVGATFALGSARGGALTDDPARTQAAGTGPREAPGFAERFGEHEADVLRVCRRMLGGDGSAEDARSEVFLRARRAYDRYDTERPFRPWLLAIAGHHCIDVLRRRATERRVFQDDEPTDADLHRSPAQDERVSPLGRALAAEQRRALGRAIESLPLKYRLPLVLRYFDDSDYAAIAGALGVTPNQVGSLLFRAKRLLRERIRRAEPAEEGP